jgi:hypothetical protein
MLQITLIRLEMHFYPRAKLYGFTFYFVVVVLVVVRIAISQIKAF